MTNVVTCLVRSVVGSRLRDKVGIHDFIVRDDTVVYQIKILMWITINFRLNINVRTLYANCTSKHVVYIQCTVSYALVCLCVCLFVCSLVPLAVCVCVCARWFVRLFACSFAC